MKLMDVAMQGQSLYTITKNLKWIAVAALFSIGLASMPASAAFIPPQSMSPSGTNVILDETFIDEAWMVYTYEIDERGAVFNVNIHSSNGIESVEQEVIRQVNNLTFMPASKDGKPIGVAAQPVVFTWILDQPREMSSEFAKTYKAAQTLMGKESLDAAFDEMAKLKSYQGRSAFEEVKLQSLAATLADRWDDEAAELQHLNRVIELQTLADYKRFEHRYVDTSDYLQIFDRVLVLQLSRMMLADAAKTLEKIIDLDAGSKIAVSASSRYRSVAARFADIPEVVIEGELLPMYRSGPGIWKTGLSRTRFSISDVNGKIDTIFLACDRGEIRLAYPSSVAWDSPRGWEDCRIEFSGMVGSRLKLHQLGR
ncbi:MAG: hypothetical protein ACI81O_001257 [Cyclobacteriaceae bacterium]|jgi:hypothetical protein